NGEAKFTLIRPFPDSSDLRDFAWADLDGDGDPDAALLDAKGGLRIYANERAGTFQPRPSPERIASVAAIAIADADGDDTLDLIALQDDGAMKRISNKDDGLGWDVAQIGLLPLGEGKSARLLVADMDNNGSLDLIAAEPVGGNVWLGQGAGRFAPL